MYPKPKNNLLDQFHQILGSFKSRAQQNPATQGHIKMTTQGWGSLTPEEKKSTVGSDIGLFAGTTKAAQTLAPQVVNRVEFLGSKIDNLKELSLPEAEEIINLGRQYLKIPDKIFARMPLSKIVAEIRGLSGGVDLRQIRPQ